MGRRTALRLLGALLLSVSRAASGAAPAAPTVVEGASWSATSFADDAGIRGRFLFEGATDADGHLWIAGADGLREYDGVRWRRHDERDGLPSAFVRCVCIDRRGVVWAGTDRGVARLVDGAFRPLDDADAAKLAGTNIRRIVESRDGALWFCADQWRDPGASGGLSRWHDGDWTTWTVADGLPSDYVSDFFEDALGRQFVLTDHGLAMRADAESPWTRPWRDLELAGADEYVRSIAETAALGVVATTASTFFRLHDGRWSAWTPSPALRVGDAKLCALRDGRMVTATNGRPKLVLRVDAESLTPITDELPVSGGVHQLLETPWGEIWIIGYGLLARWDRGIGEWTEWAPLPPVITTDARGRVIFGQPDSSWRLDGRRWTALPGVDGAVACDDAGGFWGWRGDEILHVDDAGAVERFGPAATGFGRIGGCMLDARGRAWFHGRDERGAPVVTAHEDGRWATIDAAALGSGIVSDLAAAADGRVWACVADDSREPVRILRVDRAPIRAVEGPRRSTPNPVRVLATDDRLWVYGDIGLHWWRDDGLGWRRVADTPGGNVLFGLVSGEQCIFISNGVTGGTRGCTIVEGDRITHRGLDHDGPAVATRDGSILFGGWGTVLRVRPDGSTDELRVPIDAEVQTIVEDGDALWITAGGRTFRHAHDGLPPETTLLAESRRVARGESLPVRFDAVAPGQPRGERSFRFSWRIDDGAWSSFRADLPDAIGADLEAGGHRLEVRARDPNGDVDPSAAHLDFTVVPTPIQSRWWFLPAAFCLGVLVVCLGVAAGVGWWRVRRHAVGLESEVDRRTTDLRESERRQRRLTNELDHRVRNNLLAVLGLVDQTMASTTSDADFRRAFASRVRAMAQTHELLAAAPWSGVDLTQALRATIEPYAREGQVRLADDAPPVLLPPTAASPLLLAFHELATNALKHGALTGADGWVRVDWSCDDGELDLRWIEGGGPPVMPATENFGRSLIRGFVEHELGGTLVMDFAETGLETIIRVPLGRSGSEPHAGAAAKDRPERLVVGGRGSG